MTIAQRKPPAKRAHSGLVGRPYDPDDTPVTVAEPSPSPAPPAKKRGRPSTGTALSSTERARKKRLGDKVQTVLDENKDDHGRLPNERSGEGDRKFGASEIERLANSRILHEDGGRRVQPGGFNPKKWSDTSLGNDDEPGSAPLFGPGTKATGAEWEKLTNHHKRIYHIADWAFYELGNEGDPLFCRLCGVEVKTSDEAFNHVAQTLDALDKNHEHYKTLTELPGAPESLINAARASVANNIHYAFLSTYNERPRE
jgi:hypothetical protein